MGDVSHRHEKHTYVLRLPLLSYCGSSLGPREHGECRPEATHHRTCFALFARCRRGHMGLLQARSRRLPYQHRKVMGNRGSSLRRHRFVGLDIGSSRTSWDWALPTRSASLRIPVSVRWLTARPTGRARSSVLRFAMSSRAPVSVNVGRQRSAEVG